MTAHTAHIDRNDSAHGSPQDALRTFWGQRYAAPGYAYGTEPNAFLVQHLPALHALPTGARVLCLADGEGRNGVWLAQQGYQVTSLDIAPEGCAKARALAQERQVALTVLAADVTQHDLGDAAWDAIVSIFLHLPPGARRRLHQSVCKALRPGGFFLWEAYAPAQLGQTTGGPQTAALLPPLADVVHDFADAPRDIRHQWAGWREVQEGALHSGQGAVTQLIVQRHCIRSEPS
ncbi:MAG: class I SAM-dependent methyltransferase [Comamonadaceae bacterium]|nr:MAG: class I SAM-dependent methyltransferase [Comamonadaceae bacterium]